MAKLIVMMMRMVMMMLIRVILATMTIPAPRQKNLITMAGPHPQLPRHCGGAALEVVAILNWRIKIFKKGTD